MNNNNIVRPTFVLTIKLWHDAAARWRDAAANLATRDKIAAFANLPDGWHYGSGTRPSDATIRRALEVHDVLLSLGFAATEAFPGPNGEIVVTAYEREHCLEIVAESDGSVSIIYEIGKQPGQPRYRMSTVEARQLLAEIASHIWNTSDYSTLNSLIKSEVASQASHFGIRAAREVSPSFHVTAYKQQAQLYATTYTDFMHWSPESRWYSGSSMISFSQKMPQSNKSLPTPEMVATATS